MSMAKSNLTLSRTEGPSRRASSRKPIVHMALKIGAAQHEDILNVHG
jgi:hypothetical protein